jgi:hypothetical protein
VIHLRQITKLCHFCAIELEIWHYLYFLSFISNYSNFLDFIIFS